MSLFPAILRARKHTDEQTAAPVEPAPAEPALELHDDPDALPVFDLVPPEQALQAELEQAQHAAPQPLEAPELLESPEPPPLPQGRNVHTIGISDLTRLAIDNDGRLYWDGKPVEVSRRILMSRRQVLGATALAIFVVIGALGAAIQGASAARDWACRLGWSSNLCTPPVRNSPDIPA